MAVFRIAVIGGDGIGPEVIDEAIRGAEAAARKHDRADCSGTGCRGARPTTRNTAA